MKTQSMLMPKWALSIKEALLSRETLGLTSVTVVVTPATLCPTGRMCLYVCVWVWVGESVSARPLTKTVFNIPMVGWQLQRQSKEKEDNCHALSPSCSQLLSPYTRTHSNTHIHWNMCMLSEHRVKSELRLGTEMPLSGAHRDLPVAALGILTNSHIAWGHSCTQTETVME